MVLIVNVDACVARLRRGYCLWLGAGVGVELGRAGCVKVPDWNALTAALEQEAGLPLPADAGLTLPDRLELSKSALGLNHFQKLLRENTLNVLSRAVLGAAKQRQDRTDSTIIPDELRRLVQLGHAANPIVNFNIEDLTSCAVAGAGGWQLKAFAPLIPGAVTSIQPSRGGEPPNGAFRRHIYHPHGAIDASGLCVMSATEYSAMRGTLAFELAVHAAFRSPLLIVGMSLDDRYLREQLGHFRSHIDDVLWVRADEATPEDSAWAHRHDVSIVRFGSWSDFWTRIDSLPTPDEVSMTRTWMNVVMGAVIALQADQMLSQFREAGQEPGDDWKQFHALRGLEDRPSAKSDFESDSIQAIVAYLARVRKKSADRVQKAQLKPV